MCIYICACSIVLFLSALSYVCLFYCSIAISSIIFSSYASHASKATWQAAEVSLSAHLGAASPCGLHRPRSPRAFEAPGSPWSGAPRTAPDWAFGIAKRPRLTIMILKYIILYCIVSYYIILYYIILYYIILYYIISYYIILYYNILYYYIILYYIALSYLTLSYLISSYIILCYIILYYFIFSYITCQWFKDVCFT